MSPQISTQIGVQSGVSLIEVLVAIVILSIGLLGIAGLQLTSFRFIHNANLTYQAALQANDMVMCLLLSFAP